MVVRAVQDHLMTPAAQPGPAVGNVPHVIGPGCLKAARAERAHAIGPIRPVLPPGGDDHVGTRQRVDTEISFAHGSPPGCSAPRRPPPPRMASSSSCRTSYNMIAQSGRPVSG